MVGREFCLLGARFSCSHHQRGQCRILPVWALSPSCPPPWEHGSPLGCLQPSPALPALPASGEGAVEGVTLMGSVRRVLGGAQGPVQPWGSPNLPRWGVPAAAPRSLLGAVGCCTFFSHPLMFTSTAGWGEKHRFWQHPAVYLWRGGGGTLPGTPKGTPRHSSRQRAPPGAVSPPCVSPGPPWAAPPGAERSCGAVLEAKRRRGAGATHGATHGARAGAGDSRSPHTRSSSAGTLLEPFPTLRQDFGDTAARFFSFYSLIH